MTNSIQSTQDSGNTMDNTSNTNTLSFPVFSDMYDLQLFNSQKGFHFFSPQNMKFSGSRVQTLRPYAGCVFVTSEFTGFDRSSRAYSVRVMHKDGSISTWGNFNGYNSRRQAHNDAQWLGEQVKANKVTFDKDGYCLTVID